MPLIGKHQILNCITAVETLFQLRELETLLSQMPPSRTALPGFGSPPGWRSSAATLGHPGRRPQPVRPGRPGRRPRSGSRAKGLWGHRHDAGQDCEQALSLLLPKVSRVMAVSASNPAPRGESLAAICRRHCNQVDFRESAQEGLKDALARVGTGGGPGRLRFPFTWPATCAPSPRNWRKLPKPAKPDGISHRMTGFPPRCGKPLTQNPLSLWMGIFLLPFLGQPPTGLNSSEG